MLPHRSGLEFFVGKKKLTLPFRNRKHGYIQLYQDRDPQVPTLGPNPYLLSTEHLASAERLRRTPTAGKTDPGRFRPWIDLSEGSAPSMQMARAESRLTVAGGGSGDRSTH
jgi:hypothetical protein